jgi:hypothetical protein
MPVIGRLDEQVNEVLITPLEKGREPRPAPDEPPTATPATTEEAPDGETSPPPDELPVWML